MDPIKMLIWIIIASIFFIFFWAGRQATKNLENIKPENMGGITENGGMVFPGEEVYVISELKSVIKKISFLSGLASLLSAVAAFLSVSP